MATQSWPRQIRQIFLRYMIRWCIMGAFCYNNQRKFCLQHWIKSESKLRRIPLEQIEQEYRENARLRNQAYREIQLPPLGWKLTAYFFVSILLNYYNLIRIWYISISGELAGCHFPGQFYLGPFGKSGLIGHLFSFYSSGCHAAWRTYSHLFRSEQMFDQLIWLAQPIELANREARSFESAEKTNHRQPISGDSYYELLAQLISYSTASVRTMHGSRMSPQRAQIRKLRPTRSPESRRRTERALMSWFLFASLFSLGIFLFMAFPSYLSASRYKQNYASCLELESPDSWHRFRIQRTLADAITNTWGYLDTFSALFSFTSYMLIVNKDLLNYVGAIHARLERRLAHWRSLKLESLRRTRPDTAYLDPIGLAPRLPTRPLLSGIHSGDQKLIPKWLKRPSEQEAIDIRDQLADMLALIRRTNNVTDDLFSVLISIWLVAVAMSSYVGTSRSDSQALWNIRVYQLAGFLVVSAIGSLLLRVYWNLCATYRTLCSVLVFEAGREQARFGPILSLFANSRVPTYTLFKRYEISPTTYVTITGWLVSCTLVTESLAAGEHARAALGASL